MTPNIIQQSDRDAAAKWLHYQGLRFPSREAEAVQVAAGEYDDHSLVQAFASYRLQIMEEAAKWQPIETAPKRDESSWSPTFLAWAERYGDPFPCRQRNGCFFDLEILDRDGDWSQAYPPPTHWRPLPEAPEALRTNHRANEGGGDE